VQSTERLQFYVGADGPYLADRYADVRMHIVRDGAPEVSLSKRNAEWSGCRIDDAWYKGTSWWKASPRGASLDIYGWDSRMRPKTSPASWDAIHDTPICVDIKTLIDRARRIVASSYLMAANQPDPPPLRYDVLRRVELVGMRSNINHFDPDS